MSDTPENKENNEKIDNSEKQENNEKKDTPKSQEDTQKTEIKETEAQKTEDSTEKTETPKDIQEIQENQDNNQKKETPKKQDDDQKIETTKSEGDNPENTTNEDKKKDNNNGTKIKIIIEDGDEENSKEQIVHIEDRLEVSEDEITNNETNTPRNLNSPVTPVPSSRKNSIVNRRPSVARKMKILKNKEIFIQKGKNKLQERPDKNKVRYLTEEEINLAFQWFTNGRPVITPADIKDRFDDFFQISKNDKKFYVAGGIKQDTRHLINTREEKIQSEMFESKQTISSLKKMLLKYPFKMKDYDNAFSILFGGGELEEAVSKEMLNSYVEILKSKGVPVKNDAEKILRCFDRDKDGQLGVNDLFKMRLSDLKKITDDFG